VDKQGNQIEELRRQLLKAAKEAGFDFRDPKIQQISEELDKLIVASMQRTNKP